MPHPRWRNPGPSRGARLSGERERLPVFTRAASRAPDGGMCKGQGLAFLRGNSHRLGARTVSVEQTGAEGDSHLRKWKVSWGGPCHETWRGSSRLGCVIFL